MPAPLLQDIHSVVIEFRGWGLHMPWFAPLALILGYFGTKMGLHVRHEVKRLSKDQGWWLIILLSWLPLVYWALAQVIRQY